MASTFFLFVWILCLLFVWSLSIKPECGVKHMEIGILKSENPRAPLFIEPKRPGVRGLGVGLALQSLWGGSRAPKWHMKDILSLRRTGMGHEGTEI